MSKDNKAVMLYRMQSVARLTRTALATRLLELGLYAGQDAVMLQLAAEDGLPPGVLAQRLGVRPPTITKTITRLQSQGFWSNGHLRQISASRMSISRRRASKRSASSKSRSRKPKKIC